MHARDINCFIHADIAVGAPFDVYCGKVFIYHGSNGTSIINTMVQQVIFSDIGLHA